MIVVKDCHASPFAVSSLCSELRLRAPVYHKDNGEFALTDQGAAGYIDKLLCSHYDVSCK